LTRQFHFVPEVGQYAANLSASGKISSALAGTAAVIASMTSALTNLPVVFKRLSRPALLKMAFSTTLQVAIGIAVLAVQRFAILR
jgi:phosphoribosylcarboxyaminoimidazole (NCAIR) mutase